MSERIKKIIRKLDQKKFRQELGLYKVEGIKLISEAIQEGLVLENLLVLEKFQEDFQDHNPLIVDEKTLDQLTSFKTHQGCIAVISMQKEQQIKPSDSLIILDGVSDPGNLGTIIRTADWYGINQVIGIPPFVDPYNPKTIQASMGSFYRVNVQQCTVEETLDLLKNEYQDRHVLVADMNGQSARTIHTEKPMVLVMGSESHGPSKIWNELNQTTYVTIPKFATSRAESLNVGVATAILLERFQG